MELRGNATSYSGATTHRPIPHATSEPRRGTHTPPAPKKAGLDWDALKPTCTGCGEKSSQLGEGALCPTCRGTTETNLFGQRKTTTKGSHTYGQLTDEEVARRYVDDTRLGRDLAELEETDPMVAAAADSLALVVDQVVNPEDHVDPVALEVVETPQVVEEAPSPAPQEVEPTRAPRPAVPTPAQELDAQITHATRVLRDTADRVSPAARLLRLNALSAIEALHLFTQMSPETPAGEHAPDSLSSVGVGSEREVGAASPAGQTAEHPSEVLSGTPEGGAEVEAARPPATRKARGGPRAERRDKIHLDANSVITAYQSGLSLVQVAQMHGCSHPVISRILDEHDITRRQAPTKVTPALVEQVRSLYVDEQLNQAQVAERLTLTTKVIQNIMTKHDIPVRPSAAELSKAGIGHPIKIPTEDHPRIVERYLSGESAPAIAATYDAVAASIYSILKKAGCTERHNNRCKTDKAADYAKPLKARMAELGVTSRQVKDWALAQGLVEDIRVGLPSARLVDAYAAAHPTTEEIAS